MLSARAKLATWAPCKRFEPGSKIRPPDDLDEILDQFKEDKKFFDQCCNDFFGYCVLNSDICEDGQLNIFKQNMKTFVQYLHSLHQLYLFRKKLSDLIEEEVNSWGTDETNRPSGGGPDSPSSLVTESDNTQGLLDDVFTPDESFARKKRS